MNISRKVLDNRIHHGLPPYLLTSQQGLKKKDVLSALPATICLFIVFRWFVKSVNLFSSVWSTSASLLSPFAARASSEFGKPAPPSTFFAPVLLTLIRQVARVASKYSLHSARRAPSRLPSLRYDGKVDTQRQQTTPGLHNFCRWWNTN